MDKCPGVTGFKANEVLMPNSGMDNVENAPLHNTKHKIWNQSFDSRIGLEHSIRLLSIPEALIIANYLPLSADPNTVIPKDKRQILYI